MVFAQSFLIEMRIALIGYGKMGKTIHALAKQKGIEVTAIIDPFAPEATAKEITADSLKGADVCIDFTQPDALLENLKKIAALKKNIVVGTTGWYANQEEAKKIVQQAKIGLIFASNFSIGVNVFYRIVKSAARLFNNFSDYDAFVFELHHNKKKDSPSGTAKSIAEIILQELKRKKSLVFEKLDRAPETSELHVASVRAGNIPGTHVVGFDSNADCIELKHEARNREGFAAGALLAAEWINGKNGFFTIDDLMDGLIKER